MRHIVTNKHDIEREEYITVSRIAEEKEAGKLNDLLRLMQGFAFVGHWLTV